MTRSARSAWNFLAAVAFSVISMVVALVVTPMLLRALGPARLGASRAVMDWAGYLVLLELGLNGSLMPLLSRALAGDDRQRVKAIMAAGFRAYSLVTVPMVLGALLLAASITHLIKIEPALYSDLQAAALFAAAPLLLMPLSPLRALAEANQRGYVLSLFLIVQSLVIAGTGVTLARAGWGIEGQTLAIAIGALVFGMLVVVDARRSAGGMLPSLQFRDDPERNRDIWKLNGPTLLINVCGRVGLLTDNIVVGSILSAPLIVPFLMTQRLGQIAQSQLQVVGTASWAGLAQLHARGEGELFRKRFLELNQLVMMLGFAVLGPIVAYNHAFVRLWVGETSYAGLSITALAASNGLALALASLWSWLFGGTGQLARLVPQAAASAGLNLIVSVGFTWFMAERDPSNALLGPVLGTSAALLLVNLPVMPFMLRKHFDIPVRALFAALISPLLIGVPYCAVLVWHAERTPPRGWLSLAIQMAAAGSLFAAACWLLLLDAEAKKLWLLRFKLAVGRS